MESLTLKNIIIILLLSVIGFGCNDEEFLKETPKSEVSTQSFYKSSKQFEQAIVGAYNRLQDLADHLWAFEEMRSDNSTAQQGPPAMIHWYNLDQFTMDPGNDYVGDMWDGAYELIGRCNAVLHYIKNKEIENKARYIAEAKFLRAVGYEYLVQYWGEVPLVTKKINTYEEAFKQNKRTSKDKIYEQIISDLNDAKQNLPKSWSEENEGRATEGAARTLLAKVLMWRSQYGDAASELEKVKNSGQYALLEDYSSVFDINNENNEEIIFSIQFKEGPYGLDSDFQYDFLPYEIDNEYLSGHSQGKGGKNLPTMDLLNSFEEGDERMSMIDTTFTHTFGYYHDSIVPFTRKYMHPGHSVQSNTGANFPVLRYPHVLLMLAECYVREGGGDPVSLVNQIRERAELPPLSNVTLDDIIHERRVEFHCEADRWSVLVRTGRAKEVMKTHGKEEVKRPIVTSYGKIKLLYPIPSGVMELDPNIQQNSEYR